jgi:hypothetical protein
MSFLFNPRFLPREVAAAIVRSVLHNLCCSRYDKPARESRLRRVLVAQSSFRVKASSIFSRERTLLSTADAILPVLAGESPDYPTQVKHGINLPHQMVRRDDLVEIKGIEKLTLADLSASHHRTAPANHV